MSVATQQAFLDLIEDSIACVQAAAPDSPILPLLLKKDFEQRGGAMQIADFFHNRGQLQFAAEWYRYVSEHLEPTYPCAYSNQAKCLTNLYRFPEALAVLNDSLTKVNFSLSAYTLQEFFAYLQVYSLIVLKSGRGNITHPVFPLLTSFLNHEQVTLCGNDNLKEQCKALCLLGEGGAIPNRMGSKTALRDKIDSFALTPSGGDRLIISRPGNVEVVACLGNSFTWTLGNNAGIYPAKDSNDEQRQESFSLWKKLYVEAMSVSDHIMIANFFDNYAGPYVSLLGLEDKSVDYPGATFWIETLSRLLENKVVLCISPFAKTMKHQSRHLNRIHENVLPFNTKNLRFYACAQSIAFSSEVGWAENFNTMKRELSGLDFDIALISAGGYGHPLVTYLAQEGRSAIYCGGLLQLVFGITGKRFDEHPNVVKNTYWRRPSWDETPVGFTEVEGGCYW